jgi:hypothetical protein
MRIRHVCEGCGKAIIFHLEGISLDPHEVFTTREKYKEIHGYIDEEALKNAEKEFEEELKKREDREPHYYYTSCPYCKKEINFVVWTPLTQ